MRLIDVSEVRYSYGGADEALSGVSMYVGYGEAVALAGANGSGKSTLAKLMNALIVPSSGYMITEGFDSRDRKNRFEIRKRVALVFQNPDNQIVGETAEDDVAFGPENMGLDPKEIARRTDECLACVGLSDMRFENPSHLSGGQKQLLAIAGVLALKPRCIVFDEALSMLDPKEKKQVLDCIIRLCREDGLSVVMITHDLSEAVFADRMYIMDCGKIAAEGRPSDILYDFSLLRSHGLREPAVCSLSRKLRSEGYGLEDGILTEDDLIGQLRRAQC